MGLPPFLAVGYWSAKSETAAQPGLAGALETGIPRCTSAATTSRYRGSPAAPGSLVRSSTVMWRTCFGSFSVRWRLLKGR